MADTSFIPEYYRQLMQANGLSDFETIWSLQLDWLEPLNRRRQGWSGIAKAVLQSKQCEETEVYIKKQSNFICRTLRHPVRGIPTFRREFNNLMALQSIGVNCADVLYYGEQHHGRLQEAILILKGLTGYVDLNEWNQHHVSLLSDDEVKLVLDSLANTLHILHTHHYQHSCLYGKHIFVSTGMAPVDNSRICLIDMEKMRKRISMRQIIQHDMSQLYRRSSNWSSGHFEYLLDTYARQFSNPDTVRRWLGACRI